MINNVIIGNGNVAVGVSLCELTDHATGKRVKAHAITLGDLDVPFEVGEELPKNAGVTHTGIVVLNIEALNVLKKAVLFIEERMLKEQVE